MLHITASVLRFPVCRYIASQRDRLARSAEPPAASAAVPWHEYFDASDLGRLRIVQGDPLPVANPPFSHIVRRFGLTYPDLTMVDAITFDHVIAARVPLTPDLLFHELVHVVQYRLLGVSEFAYQYTRGFLSRRSYNEIPLEVCAYELDRRFRLSAQPFDVEAEVKAWFSRGLC
jgi:hypothetical protein